MMILASAGGAAAAGGGVAVIVVIIGVLLFFAPLGIWTVASGIRKDNRRAAYEICKRLDELIAATGGTVPESKSAVESVAFAAGRLAASMTAKANEQKPEKPRTGGGYSSLHSSGWNRPNR